jgi:hypothetical protein
MQRTELDVFLSLQLSLGKGPYRHTKNKDPKLHSPPLSYREPAPHVSGCNIKPGVVSILGNHSEVGASHIIFSLKRTSEIICFLFFYKGK